jgi:hypothetical protein
MAGLSLVTVGAFAAGLAVTLVLAAFFTPRAWWRRANARAIAVLALGTFAFGSALAWLGGPATPARAATLVQAHAGMPQAGSTWVVWDDLNLRASTTVGAPRLGVVPAGARVTATGNSAGDWWEISARVDGRLANGWASSLWLRRAEEARK